VVEFIRERISYIEETHNEHGYNAEAPAVMAELAYWLEFSGLTDGDWEAFYNLVIALKEATQKP
jgi:hypothetical protein